MTRSLRPHYAGQRLTGLSASTPPAFSPACIKDLERGARADPTLKMLVDRDAAITTFKKEKYYHVRLIYPARKRQARRSPTAAKLSRLKAACEASQAVCFPCEREENRAAAAEAL